MTQIDTVDHQCPFPFDNTPSTIWTHRRSRLTRSAEVRFVPIGVEARILLSDGELLYSRIFTEGELALAWAKEEREELLRNGWIEVPTISTRRM